MNSKSSRLESWQNTINELTETVDALTRLVRSSTRLARSAGMFIVAASSLAGAVVLALHF
jgi:hypothetical protein